MQSKAATVAEYLASLPAERADALNVVRKVILANLDPGYVEGMQYGMIGYYVPHSIYPAGYHCDPKQPLPFAGLASQKGHMSLYLMSVYSAGAELQALRAGFAKAGKKLDMGKSCIRFRRADDLALDAVAGAFRRMPARAWIAQYEGMLLTGRGKTAKAKRKSAAKVAPGKGSRRKTPAKRARPAKGL